MVKKTIPLINNQALMEEYDYEKNISLDISKLTCASNKKVWWICPQNHSYESQIANRATGCGCPYCAGKKFWLVIMISRHGVREIIALIYWKNSIQLGILFRQKK